VLTVARVVFVLFAALLILGGIAGFVEKRSVMSLASGILCGGMATYAVVVMSTRPTFALVLGLAAAILAGGGMAPRLKDKATGEIKMWPAGAVVAMSLVTVAVAAAGLAVTRGAASR
jgi:uncharacterized membrane protein (UPF0136 family)